jgi:rhodanese-related sulfurtransferase
MEVEVLELKKMLKNNEVVLLDVREPYEIEICNVKGSLFIPMNEIPQNFEQLDKEKRYAVMCHSGVRSLYVSNYLNSLGYSTLNVVGGIERWATDVDKNMKRY